MKKKMEGTKRRMLALVLALAMIVCGMPLYSDGVTAQAAETTTWASWEDLYDVMVAKEEEDGFDYRSIDLQSLATWADNYEGYDTDGWELLVEIMEGLDIADAETDYEKVYAIANWIGANVSYSGTNFTYLVLTEGEGLCGGYASLFCIMCAYVGVSAIEVTCTETNHAWNAVKVDGNWYWADITNFTSVEEKMSLSSGSPAFLYGNDSMMVLEYWNVLENAVAAGSAVNSLISDYSYYYYNSSCNGDHDWFIEAQGSAGINNVCDHGGISYRCSKCGCNHVEIFDSDVAHAWETVTVEPTCTSDGYSYEICSVCGIYHLLDGSFYDYKFDITEALGHDETDTDDLIITKEPTCTASGIGYTYCTRCGQKITKITLPAAGHSWDDGEVTTAATATTAGVKTYTCQTCGTTKTETIAATGGSLSDAVITLEYDSCVYDGELHYPEVAVSFDGVEVENTVTSTTTGSSTKVLTGTMYTVTYRTGAYYKAAGEIPVVISAGTNGLLTGEVTVYFTIEKLGTTVTASIDEDTITTGSTAQITASAVTDNGTARTCKYESSDTSVATVSSSGVVTGVSSGVAVITVSTSSSSYYETGYAYITVTVTDPGNTDISGAAVTLGTSSYTYDGTAKEPSVTVKYGSTTLSFGTDYMVSYADNTDAGTATVTVAGCGSYTGSITKTFTIAQADVSGAAVTLDAASYTYDGSAKTPSLTVTLGANTLVYGTDYTAVYSSNTNAGTAKVTITGCGNYTGTLSKTYTIAQADISGAVVMLSSNEYTYTGSAKKPAVTVTLNGAELASGTDYTVSYSGNTNAGTAAVTVTGTGNYTGTATAKFVITKASPVITASDVSVACGSTVSLGASVTSGGTLTYESSDTSVATVSSSGVVTGLKSGTAEITINAAATDNYNAAFTTITATVGAVDISGATVTAGSGGTYDGTAKTPSVTVVLDGVTLTSGTDYLVSYSNNINAGTATVTVTGCGNYTGTATAAFTIAKAAQVVTLSAGSTTVTAGSTLSLTGSVSTGNTLTYTSSDTSVATVSSSGVVTGISAGTATITAKVAATDNYSAGSASITITVKASSSAATDLSGATVTPATSSYTYDGTAKTPSVTVKLGSATLTKGTDYTVSYNNNINAGTATVTVTGCGNYTGTATATFTIAKAAQVVTLSAGSTTVTAGNTLSLTGSVSTGVSLAYTSSDTSVATVSSSGVVTGISVGTATITAKAAGTTNYSAGSASVTITVKLASASITAISNITSGIKVKWDKVTGASGYYVYRKTSGGSYSKVKTITSGSTVSYTDTAVKSKSGTTYVYKVLPYYKDSSGTVTKGSSTNTKTIIRLSSAKISSLANTSSGIKVKWGKVTGASGYYVYRKTSSGSYSKVKTITSGSTVSYTDTAVKSKNGTTYIYKVIPYYKSSSGTVTKGSYANTKTTARLTAVSISSLKNSSSKKMTVKWAKNSKATGYQIQYSASSSFSSYKTVTVSGSSTVSKVISSLTKGKTYYVRVRAYKTVSGTKYYSAWSSKKSVKISK